MTIYKINLQNPVLRQFRVLRNISLLYPCLRDVEGAEVYLYGSWARGDNSEKSDIDLLVISEERGFGTGELSRKIKTEIKPIVLTPLEYSRLSREDKPFYERLEREKLRLV